MKYQINKVRNGEWRLTWEDGSCSTHSTSKRAELMALQHAEPKKEIVICAAVEYNGKVWYGHRHHQALAAMKDTLSYDMSRKDMEAAGVDRNQGFVTSMGRFVDREQAHIIAGEAGQITFNKYNENTKLYSEDIY